MITMLHSWSFELNSNKSFGIPDPSIPIRLHGHFASKNLPVGGANAPILGRRHPSHFSHSSYHSHPSLILSASRFPPVNSVKTPAIHVCNPLVARVRTVSHENKIFFLRFEQRKKTTSQKTMLRL